MDTPAAEPRPPTTQARRCPRPRTERSYTPQGEVLAWFLVDHRPPLRRLGPAMVGAVTTGALTAAVWQLMGAGESLWRTVPAALVCVAIVSVGGVLSWASAVVSRIVRFRPPRAEAVRHPVPQEHRVRQTLHEHFLLLVECDELLERLRRRGHRDLARFLRSGDWGSRLHPFAVAAAAYLVDVETLPRHDEPGRHARIEQLRARGQALSEQAPTGVVTEFAIVRDWVNARDHARGPHQIRLAAHRRRRECEDQHTTAASPATRTDRPAGSPSSQLGAGSSAAGESRHVG